MKNVAKFTGTAIALMLLGTSCTEPISQKQLPDVIKPQASNSAYQENDTRITVASFGFSYQPISEGVSTHISGQRLNFGDGTISFIEHIKNKSKSFTETVRTFAKAHGATETDCTLTFEKAKEGDHPFLSSGMETGYIVPKLIFTPTTAQIYTNLRSASYGHANATDKQLAELCASSPECGWAASDLKIAAARKACGFYTTIPGERIVAKFIAAKNDSDPILFIFSSEGQGGSASGFDGGPIQFLE